MASVSWHPKNPSAVRWLPTFVRKIPPSIREIVDRLQGAGHQAYIVGGAIRNHRLRRPIYDWDICTSARPAENQTLFADYSQRSFGPQYGFVTLRARESGLSSVDVYTLRGHRNAGGDEWTYTDDLRTDLFNRDFTMNAMAVDPVKLQFYDPFDGLRDIERRLVRSVRPAMQTIRMSESHAYRAIRFAVELGFRVSPALLDAIYSQRRFAAGMSKELRGEEMLRMLASSEPGRAIEMLRRSGLLIQTLWELEEDCRDIKVGRKFGRSFYDYILRLLDACPVSTFRKYPQYPGLLRLALIVGAMGYRKILNERRKPLPAGERNWTFKEAGKNASRAYATLLDVVKIPANVANTVADFIWQLHPMPLNIADGDVELDLEAMALEGFLLETFEVFLAMRRIRGDVLNPNDERRLRRKYETMEKRGDDVLKHREIRGDEVAKALQIQPGPLLGEVLRALKRKIAWRFGHDLQSKTAILKWLEDNRTGFLAEVEKARSPKRAKRQTNAMSTASSPDTGSVA